MDDEEIRMKCLEIAIEKNPTQSPLELVRIAKMFSDYILDQTE